MEYITPNFTKDMVKTHKILIPNMAVTQFRLMQAALASEMCIRDRPAAPAEEEDDGDYFDDLLSILNKRS